jgi:hypothetical protein
VSIFGKRSPAAFCATAAALVSACIVVSPLDDFPDAPAVGSGGSSANGGDGSGGSKAGGGGTSGAADAGEDGSGGTTLQGGSGGLGDSGGESGAGASGDAGKAGSAGAGGCSTNRECVVAGGSEPYRCRPSDRTCVSLKSPDCPLVYPDEDFPDVESLYSNPNALYVGGFATIDPVRQDQSSVIWAQRLAIEELNASDGGLPTSDGERRPLVMIVCNNDTSGDPETIDRAMQHLTEEVQVPGVVATLKPADLLRAFEEYGHDKTFFLDPVSANNTVVNYDDQDLIWTMLGPPSDYRQGYRELLELSEAYLRTTRVTDPEQKIKVALVSTTDAFNAELKSFVEPVLTFNGVSAEANGAALYMSVEVDIGRSLTQQNAQITALTNDIIAFRPDIVVSTAGEPFTREGGVLQQLEFAWDNGTGGERPFYLLSPYNAGNTSPVMSLIESQMVIAVGGQAIDATAYERFVGLSAAGAEDPTLKRGFVERLRESFGENAITDTEHYYDSVYYLAYAMFASGKALPTGPQIASGMRRLLGGDPFAVGPEQIEDVFEVLAEEDATIELIGALGPPDFNARTGVRIGTTSVFCFSKTSTTSVALRSDVLRYDLELGEFRGDDFPCFTGFFPP